MSRRPHVAVVSYHLEAGRVARWPAEEILDPFDALAQRAGA
jgi:hypothetical protein